MKHVFTILFILSISSTLFSQTTINDVLKEVEKNNTALSALRKQADAEKLGNKTGIFLQNPEVEFNYLFGNPTINGNRTDISISQSFDFPTAYGYRNQISNSKNEQVELEYEKLRKELIHEARLICFDLIYTNALKSELSKRLLHAQSIADAYTSKFKLGETNILEYNKAQLNLINLGKEMESLNIERTVLLGELARLNGGIIIDLTDSMFGPQSITMDFDQWYVQLENSNPVLKWLKLEIEISQKQAKLNSALSLPKFQAGYMSETVVGQEFNGVSVGLSIPLWENKNSVKFAKAQTLAIKGIEDDNRIQFYNTLKSLHSKAIALQSNVSDYRLQLSSFDNTDLLRKALDIGEISLIEYMLELSFYYESVEKLLEMERELSKTQAEIVQYL